jgi:hypothetical protein
VRTSGRVFWTAGVSRQAAVEQRQRVLVDLGVRLAHPDRARVDDGVEQLVDRQPRLPGAARLGDVVGEDRGASTGGAGPTDGLDHRRVDPFVWSRAQVREHLEQVELHALLGGQRRDLLPRRRDVELTSLAPVPRVVGVLVVRTEQRRQRGVELVALRLAEEADGGERRRHEHPAEVVHNCFDHGRQCATRPAGKRNHASSSVS